MVAVRGYPHSGLAGREVLRPATHPPPLPASVPAGAAAGAGLAAAGAAQGPTVFPGPAHPAPRPQSLRAQPAPPSPAPAAGARARATGQVCGTRVPGAGGWGLGAGDVWSQGKATCPQANSSAPAGRLLLHPGPHASDTGGSSRSPLGSPCGASRVKSVPEEQQWPRFLIRCPVPPVTAALRSHS